MNLITNYLNQNTIMKKIAYQAPVIKTLTMEFLMQSASGTTGRIDDQPAIGSGGTDEDGTVEPEAKSFSVWDN